MASKSSFSISDLLGRSITSYKENFIMLFNFSCAASAPVILRMLLQASTDEGISALGLLLGPVVFCVYVFFFMCLVFTAASLVQGQVVGARDVMLHVKSRFFRALGAYLIFAVLIFAGCVLLVVPGIYCLTVLLFYPFAILLEEKGIWDAFKRSQELVKGSFWSVLAANGTAFLISLGMFLPLFIGLKMMDCSDGVLLLLLGIVGTLTAPVFVIYYYFIYDNLKVATDGTLNISVRNS